MRRAAFFPIVMAILLAVGCSGGKETLPTEPAVDASPQISHSSSTGNHMLWGLWLFKLSEDHRSIDVYPVRLAGMHLNVLNLLQTRPCTHCLRVSNIVHHPPDEITFDLTLVHPFPGLPKYTGFDVRAIFISGADYEFPGLGRTISWSGNHPRMLDYDGYTSVFNPTEYPESAPVLPVFKYIRGHFARGGNPSSTLNPYIAFWTESTRRMFETGGYQTLPVRLRVPGGPLEFGYAVDACWHPPDGDVIDPVVDFPPEANCPEAYEVNVHVFDGLDPEPGTFANVEVEVHDWQGINSIGTVTLEVPGLMSSPVEFMNSTILGEDSCVFTGTIANELGAGYGDYPMLVRVTEAQPDPNLGEIDAWQFVSVGIKEGWVRTWGGLESDMATDVDLINEDILVLAEFEGTVDFDPGPGVHERTSAGERDVSLSRFDGDGNFISVLTWGNDQYDEGSGLAVDGFGNILVTGTFYGTVDFDPGPGVEERTSEEGQDVYVCKFDSSGVLQWVRTFSGVRDKRANEVAVDESGNVYVTGCFHGTTDFDPGPGVEERKSIGIYDIYLVKLDRQGEFVWVLVWGARSPSSEEGRGIAFDDAGNVYVCGEFREEADFDPGPDEEWHDGNGATDAFVSKFSQEGDYYWALTWGGFHHDCAWAVDADSNERLYVAGNFAYTVDFDPGPGVEKRTVMSSTAGFLSMFNTSGQFQWVWTENLGHGCFGLDVSPSGNPGVSGGWYTNAYTAMLTSDCQMQWMSRWGFGPYSNSATGGRMCIDDEENVYVVGRFEYTCDFDPSESVEHHRSNGEDDCHLIKLLPGGVW